MGLVFDFQTAGVEENIFYGNLRWFEPGFIQIILGKHQRSVLQLQLRVKGEHSVNLLCFLLRSLVVNKPDQVVLGKRFGHRHIGFWSFSSSG